MDVKEKINKVHSVLEKVDSSKRRRKVIFTSGNPERFEFGNLKTLELSKLNESLKKFGCDFTMNFSEIVKHDMKEQSELLSNIHKKVQRISPLLNIGLKRISISLVRNEEGINILFDCDASKKVGVKLFNSIVVDISELLVSPKAKREKNSIRSFHFEMKLVEQPKQQEEVVVDEEYNNQEIHSGNNEALRESRLEEMR